MLAAHKTEHEPGQLPREGVVLIGVDLELQRRMAEGLGVSVFREAGRKISAPNFSTPTDQQPQQPFSEALSTEAPEIGAPNCGAAKISAPIIGDALLTPTTESLPPNDSEINSAPNFSAPYLDATHIGALKSGAPNFDFRDLLVRHPSAKVPTVRPVSRIEDVFTPAERDLLQWLWENGRPVRIKPTVRVVVGPNGEGARRLAAQAGLIYNTFKNLSRALASKFALDIVKPEGNLPAIYAVYDTSVILERQRQAGFTGVVHKNGGRRELVNGQALPAPPRRPDLTVAELEQIIGAPKFGIPSPGFQDDGV